MSVSEKDVRHVAQLARLGLEPHRVETLVSELNGILSHMDALRAVDTDGVEPMAGAGGASQLQREDVASADRLHRAREEFAPQARDGFFVVPRLAAHEDA
jgi:aspartyl-tRNA(Asn)/glutamyl-tRNA(Gln) amidotransferase subunit C